MNFRPELYQVDSEVWCAEARLRFFGFPLTTRMTAIPCAPGEVWVHSPTPLPAVRHQLKALGSVRWRVAPNLMHHLYQMDYQEGFPESRLWAPPGLNKKRRDLRIDHNTFAAPASEWPSVIQPFPIDGNAMLMETAYLHHPSRTLMVSDLLLHLGPWDHWSVRLYAKANRFYDTPGLSFGLKSFFKDKAAARASIDRILDADFDRLILAHGPIVESGGKDVLARAFDWLRP